MEKKIVDHYVDSDKVIIKTKNDLNYNGRILEVGKEHILILDKFNEKKTIRYEDIYNIQEARQ